MVDIHNLQGYQEQLWVDNQININASNDGPWCSIIVFCIHSDGFHMRSIDGH